VPVEPTRSLEAFQDERLQLLVAAKGGHNGFHGRGGCWTDQLTARWFQALLA
jgi:predicted alpha/beta-fold hydrolase